MKIRNLLIVLLAVVFCLSGCTPEKETGEQVVEAVRAPRFALVVKDVTNPYMSHMYAGFESACAELGAQCVMAGPESLSAEGQADSIEALINEGVDAIAVTANDREVLSAALSRAIDAGIKVVSLDSSVNVSDRMVHIQQAAPDILGRVLIQAAREMIKGAGKVAILTTTQSAPNQSLWVSWILQEVSENPDNYSDIEIVDIAYGMDEYDASRSETKRLMETYPDLDIIIAPTTVGIRAASEVIREAGSDVLVTGLGLPSDMCEFVLDGICPWMYLWNPIDVGYISAYTCNALVAGEITGKEGEILTAGKLGDKRIAPSADGGTEIVVGNPYMFDAENVSVWKAIF